MADNNTDALDHSVGPGNTPFAAGNNNNLPSNSSDAADPFTAQLDAAYDRIWRDREVTPTVRPYVVELHDGRQLPFFLRGKRDPAAVAQVRQALTDTHSSQMFRCQTCESTVWCSVKLQAPDGPVLSLCPPDQVDSLPPCWQGLQRALATPLYAIHGVEICTGMIFRPVYILFVYGLI